MEKGKRGELTSSFVITTVLVIAGFVVVLYFILNGMNLGGETNEDVCAFSVLTRATSPQATSAYVPLKCTTKKICISDGKDCEDFRGEENVKKTIQLSGDIGSDKRTIEKTLADEMYNCWNMMGEGKMDLFNGGLAKTYGQEKQDVTCMICSRVKIKSKNNETLLKYIEGEKNENKVNVEEYLGTKQIEGKSETYLQYFAKDRSVNGYAKTPDDIGGKLGIYNKKTEFNDDDLTEYAVVFTQIKNKGYMDVLNNLAGLGISSVVTASQVPFVGKVATSSTGLAFIGVIGAGATVNAMSNVYQGKVAAVNHCSDFQNEETSEVEGCSTVQILPYEVESINKVCSYIEGDP